MKNCAQIATLLLVCLTTSFTLAEEGFTTLFDGSSLDGWEHNGNWVIEEDAVFRADKGGYLTYTKAPVPDDFELRFEWKVGEASNSGIYYRPTQYEYQILDNTKHNDGKSPRTSAASLYFCMPPSEDATKPAGEWNTGRVVCKGTIIQHWLNGKKVIHFDYTDPQWAFEVDLLKKRGGDLTARGANLKIQDHNDPVWFRNIRIKELSANDSIDMSPVKPAELTEEQLAAEKAKIDGIIKRRQQAAERAKQKKSS